MNWRNAWGPVVPRPAGLDWLRTVGGAAFGLALATLVVLLDERFAPQLPMHLFAPLGATAVLVFAVPTSPLAQPFSCVVGNTIPAVWALLVLHTLPAAWWPAVAVAGAIGLMLATRSLHPPGGAVALLLALTPEQTLATPWPLLLLQFGLMTAVLVGAGAAYHHATGRRYPHHASAAPAPTADQPRHASRLGLSTADLEALLQRFDLANNLDAQDLAEVLAAAEEQAIAQRLGGVNCGQLMSVHPVSCRSDEPLAAVAQRFVAHPIKSMPVLGAAGQLQGLVTRAAVFERLWQHSGALAQDASAASTGVGGWRWLQDKRSSEQRRHTLHTHRLGHATRRVAQETLAQHPELLLAPELQVNPDTPIGQLLESLASHQVPCVPVLQGAQLVGVITRTDLMRVLVQPVHQ